MKTSFYLCLLILFTGCAWLGDKDNSAPPAKLEAFEETAKLRKVWSHDTGKGTNDQLLKLVPRHSRWGRLPGRS